MFLLFYIYSVSSLQKPNQEPGSTSQSQRNSFSSQGSPKSGSGVSPTPNPYIFANDIDSVDIATRVAMVRFFNSHNTLANFTEHTRTLRLYPRPVVAFQINSFLRSRTRTSNFLNRFARTQAVEFLAEWALTPTNVAFLRVQTGLLDPTQIGDKPKWFAHGLSSIRFPVWDDGSSLNGALRSIQHIEGQKSDSDDWDSDEGSSSTSESSDLDGDTASSDIDFYGPKNHIHQINQALSSNLDPSTVYNVPKALQYPEGVKVDLSAEDDGDSTSSSQSDLSSIPGDDKDDNEVFPEGQVPEENIEKESVSPHKLARLPSSPASSILGRTSSIGSEAASPPIHVSVLFHQ